MALKDWKKNIQGRSLWRWKRKDNAAELEITKQRTTNYILKKDIIRYEVSITKLKPSNNIFAGSMYFKTKSQAFSHAKSYMKKH